MKFRAILNFEVEPHWRSAEEIKDRIHYLIVSGLVASNIQSEQAPEDITPRKFDIVQIPTKKRSPKFIAAKQQLLFR